MPGPMSVHRARARTMQGRSRFASRGRLTSRCEWTRPRHRPGAITYATTRWAFASLATSRSHRCIRRSNSPRDGSGPATVRVPNQSHREASMNRASFSSSTRERAGTVPCQASTAARAMRLPLVSVILASSSPRSGEPSARAKVRRAPSSRSGIASSGASSSKPVWSPAPISFRAP